MRAAKAQASLRICADSLEPSLLADAISVEIPYTGVFILMSNNASIKTQSCSTEGESARAIVYIYFD